MLDDEWSGALYSPRIRALGLDHLGGDPDSHDIVVTNRLTAALYAAFQVTVEPGSTVIGVFTLLQSSGRRQGRARRRRPTDRNRWRRGSSNVSLNAVMT